MGLTFPPGARLPGVLRWSHFLAQPLGGAGVSHRKWFVCLSSSLLPIKQVLHLMNKMNLPCPFGPVTARPPLVRPAFYTQTSREIYSSAGFIVVAKITNGYF